MVLIQISNVKNIEWSPRSSHLAFCTGTGRVFIWSAEGASVCEVPVEYKDFKANRVRWSGDGRSLIVADKNRFMVAYPKFEILEDGNENEIISN